VCEVKTTYGAVKGERAGGVYIWRGIPYAAPPVGELRFKKPEPPARWDGVRDVTEFGDSAPQVRRMKRRATVERFSEDCLYLNIWSPAADGEKRAVLLYIHGGSFVEGAGSDQEYDGTKLASEGDIVLVTINYRIGAIGFMDFSFFGDDFTANCGLWDIIAALKWVKENIGAFGGDPDNVTVCGQSAGASCICILSGAAEAQKYFDRAIMMSAAPTLVHSKALAQKAAHGFLEYMKISDPGSLMSASAMELAANQEEFAQKSGLGSTTFAPCIDGELVTEYPISAAQAGEMRAVSMLLGTTREEMSFALHKSLSHIVDIENIRDVAIKVEKPETRERIARAYERYGKRGPGIMFSDVTFRLPSVWLSEVQSRHADTWMYRFDYETLGMRLTGLHAFHSSDIPFLFGNFRAGLARYMFMLAPNMRGARRLHKEFRGDFLTFMKTGELPWQKCDGEDGPAKCYSLHSTVEQAVPAEVQQAYKDSEFKKRSFTGSGMDLQIR